MYLMPLFVFTWYAQKNNTLKQLQCTKACIMEARFIRLCGHAAVWGDTGRLWKSVRCLRETLSVLQGGPGQSSLPEEVEDMKRKWYMSFHVCVYLYVYISEHLCADTKWPMIGQIHKYLTCIVDQYTTPV